MHLLLPAEANKCNTSVLPVPALLLTLEVFPLLRFLPRDVPQRTKIQAAPLPIQLQPSRLCDVKLMLDVTQKGPETWFRAPQHFQRCSKCHC